MRTTQTFYDVEHGGDMEPIKDAVFKNKGKIIDEDFDYDNEIWTITVEVDIIEGFWGKVESYLRDFYE